MPSCRLTESEEFEKWRSARKSSRARWLAILVSCTAFLTLLLLVYLTSSPGTAQTTLRGHDIATARQGDSAGGPGEYSTAQPHTASPSRPAAEAGGQGLPAEAEVSQSPAPVLPELTPPPTTWESDSAATVEPDISFSAPLVPQPEQQSQEGATTEQVSPPDRPATGTSPEAAQASTWSPVDGQSSLGSGTDLPDSPVMVDDVLDEGATQMPGLSSITSTPSLGEANISAAPEGAAEDCALLQPAAHLEHEPATGHNNAANAWDTIAFTTLLRTRQYLTWPMALSWASAGVCLLLGFLLFRRRSIRQVSAPQTWTAIASAV